MGDRLGTPDAVGILLFFLYCIFHNWILKRTQVFSMWHRKRYCITHINDLLFKLLYFTLMSDISGAAAARRDYNKVDTHENINYNWWWIFRYWSLCSCKFFFFLLILGTNDEFRPTADRSVLQLLSNYKELLLFKVFVYCYHSLLLFPSQNKHTVHTIISQRIYHEKGIQW